MDPETGLFVGFNGATELDVIGSISYGGEWGPEDEFGNTPMITAPTVVDGWHVNAQGEFLPETWDQYLVVVASAFRMWMGRADIAPDAEILEQLV